MNLLKKKIVTSAATIRAMAATAPIIAPPGPKKAPAKIAADSVMAGASCSKYRAAAPNPAQTARANAASPRVAVPFLYAS